MKPAAIIYLFFIALYTQACASNNNDTPATSKATGVQEPVATAPPAPPDCFALGKVIDTVICSADATQSYALYIPANKNEKALPVIYFFDPHASGSLPLYKYQSLANAYGFVLIGSNNSKNGNDWPHTASIWQALFNDTKRRLNIDLQRIYTAGFSGGAKVAGYVALQHPEIKGVIANGAGLPDGTPAGNYNFSFTALAGEGDMNMTELVAINAAFDKTATRHRIILFNGKHEWAPAKTMDNAFAGLQFDAMYNKLLPVNDSLINGFVINNKKAVEAYNKANNLVKAVAECTLTINLLQGLTNEVNWFKEKAVSLTGNATYQQQLQSQQQLLETEQQIKAQYMQQFQQGDMNYWTKTINDLQTKAKAPTAQGAMYQRLLAYLSLAFYSFSNQFINSNQMEGAQYFVTLYKLADATNSEAWYFSAILLARKNEMAAAESDLQKAVLYGFTDKARLHQQPEFRNGLNFAKIEHGMAQSIKR
jgi:pimeloyl-ACP methyl ester carboxylesterase